MSNRDFEFIISLWISFAVERNVEDVVFLCSFDDEELYYKWPLLSMCTCSSLITLDWSCCTFDKESIIEWKSLKSLKLQYILFDDDDIVNLLSCCPALETMELSLFEGFRRVEITSSNLKRLTLASHKWPCSGNEDSLEIFAPHLQHLDISGALGHIKCRLVNVSSLVTASLTFDICCTADDSVEDDIEEESCRDYHQVFRNLVRDYLRKLSYAIELTIGSWLAEVVFMLQLEGLALPQLRCKCLTLKLQFGYEHCQLELSYLAEGDDTNLLCWIPNIVFSSLKNIKIVDCIQRCEWATCSKGWSEGDFDKLIELSKFLLKNAVVLEKFVIVAKRRKCRKCSESCASQFLTRLAKTLLDSPRSSKNFVITYQESALDD
ncbi:F-box protein At5g03100-like [Nicotiana tabacum]|uniref:F-box protein At5g03100-like n=1 Tax=Nicotiana tabacum TaxID=4097 RepID=A0AC58U9Q5_TOBAC